MPNHPIRTVGGVFGDIVFPDARPVVDVDGRLWQVFPHDSRPSGSGRNALVAAGWTGLRFTWDGLTGDLDRVVAEIQQLRRLRF